MKQKIRIILALLMLIPACKPASEKFTHNTDNPYMVGKWVITEVDNTDALVSKQTLFLSIIEEDYIGGNSLIFSPGDTFVLLSQEGDTLNQGFYGLTDTNTYLELLSPEDNKIIRYKISPASSDVLQLHPVSPGVLTSLTIEKKK